MTAVPNAIQPSLLPSSAQAYTWRVFAKGIVQRIAKIWESIKNFFGSIFGCFFLRSLPVAANQWKNLQSAFLMWDAQKREKPSSNTELDHEMQARWNKAYLTAVGSSSPEEATVFCFAERHEDKLFYKTVAHYIKAHYSKGDIILIEDEKTNPTEDIIKYHIQTKQLLSKDYLVQGWDIDNREPDAVISSKKKKEKCEEILKKIPNKNERTKERLQTLRQDLDVFVSNCKELANYHKCSHELIDSIESSVAKYFKAYSSNQCDDPKTVLSILLLDTINDIYEDDEFSFYVEPTTSEDRQWLESMNNKREESLIELIDKYRKEGKKVFVMAGYAHLLATPVFKPSFLKTVQKTLKQHKFIILASKEMAEKQKLQCYNSDLQIQSV